MVPSRDNEPGVRKRSRDGFERLDHQLEPFVSSPFSEGENAMLWVSAPGEVGVFRSSSENAVGAEVHIIAPIFFVEYLAIPRHEYGNRVGQQ
jgi:hypothetical protein